MYIYLLPIYASYTAYSCVFLYSLSAPNILVTHTQGNDSNFLAKSTKAFASHQSFSIPKKSRDEFNIHHYAGIVSYTVTGFLERNKDVIPNNMTDMMITSTNVLLRRLFIHTIFFRGEQGDVDRLLGGDRTQNAMFLLLASPTSTGTTSNSGSAGGGSSAKKVTPSRSPRMNVSNNKNESSELDGVPSALPSPDESTVFPGLKRVSVSRNRRASGGDSQSSNILAASVTSKFNYQLSSLMDTISATEVQYVRCVKPNANKSNHEFSRPLVVEQLRSAGICFNIILLIPTFNTYIILYTHVIYYYHSHIHDILCIIMYSILLFIYLTFIISYTHRHDRGCPHLPQRLP